MAFAVVGALLILLAALVRYGPDTEAGRALIVRMVNGTRVSNLGYLRLLGVSGDPWSEISAAQVDIVDSKGTWLAGRNLRVRWRPEELLERRVAITAASAGSITVMRAPVLLPPKPRSPSLVSVRLDKVDALVILEPAFAGRRGEYQTQGAVDVARSGPVNGHVSADSRLHAGDFLKADFAVTDATISVEAHAQEAMGGALAGSLGLDAGQAFLLDAQAHGAGHNGWFALSTKVGQTVPAWARGRWSAKGGDASGEIDLGASRWLAPWRAGLGPKVTFTLTGARSTGDFYRIALDGRTANAQVTASGDIDPHKRSAGPAGVSLGLAVADLSTLAKIKGLGRARVTGTLTGDQHKWNLAGDASVDKIQQAGLSFARISGPFQLAAAGNGLTLTAKAAAAGGAGSGPIAVLLGAAPKAEAQIDWLSPNRVLLRRLQLQGAALDVQGQGERGLFGALSFKGQAQARNIGAVAPGVTGALKADWRASQASSAAPWAFSVDAKGQGVHLNSPEVNSVLGAAPTLHGDGRYGPAGLALNHLAFRGAGVSLLGAGTVAPAGGMKLALEWTSTGATLLGPVSVTGPAHGTAALTGTITKPRLDATANLPAIDLPDLGGLRLRDGRLALALMSDGHDFSGHVSLTATGDSGPAKAAAAFDLTGRDVALSDIDVAMGGVILKGGAAVKGGEPTSAALTFDVGPGIFLDAGHASGSVEIAAAAGGQRVHLKANGSSLLLTDGKSSFDTVSLAADGPLHRLPYQFDGRGTVGGMAGKLSGSGLLTGTGQEHGLTFAGTGKLGQTEIHTVAPAQLTLRPSGVGGALHLGVGKGRADVNFTQGGGKLSGQATVANFELGLINPDLRGRADGTVNLSRAGRAVVGTAEARIADLSSRNVDASSSLNGTVNVTFGDDAILVRTQMAGAQGARLSAEVRVPAVLSADPFKVAVDSHRPLAGQFAADGAIGPLWDLFGGGAQSLTGRFDAHGTIAGTLADPRVTGAASVANGDFEDEAVGLKLKNLALAADLRGDAIDVAQLSASDGAKGSVTGSGRLSLVRDGASGLRLQLNGFRLIDNTMAQASASGTLNVNRGGDGKVKLAGALTIDRAQISPTPPTPSGVVEMPVVEIHRPADFAAPPPAPTAKAPPIALDISLKSAGGIFIKGRGLNLEMSLDAHIQGSTTSPKLSGDARVVRGDYNFAGKRFQIDERSVVHLGATPETIYLDLTASREDPSLTATVKITGTAAVPILTLTSDPVLPRDEILSQVLFGSSAAQLNGVQAAQLASALAGLAGNGGFDVIGGLRNFAHLDRLAIDSSAASGFTIAGGKYVTNTLYVEVSNSAKTGQGAQVEWRVRKHFAIVSRVTDQGDQAVSIRWRKDY